MIWVRTVFIEGKLAVNVDDRLMLATDRRDQLHNEMMDWLKTNPNARHMSDMSRAPQWAEYDELCKKISRCRIIEP